MFIKVKVHAGEKQNKFAKKAQDTFEIRVKARAERGLANAAVKEILARELNIDAKKLNLIKGASSPSKIFEIK